MSNMNDGLPATGFVRRCDVIGPGKMFPWSRSTLYRRIASGDFPQPIPLGPGMVGWTVEQIRAKRDEMAKQTHVNTD